MANTSTTTTKTASITTTPFTPLVKTTVNSALLEAQKMKLNFLYGLLAACGIILILSICLIRVYCLLCRYRKEEGQGKSDAKNNRPSGTASKYFFNTKSRTSSKNALLPETLRREEPDGNEKVCPKEQSRSRNTEVASQENNKSNHLLPEIEIKISSLRRKEMSQELPIKNISSDNDYDDDYESPTKRPIGENGYYIELKDTKESSGYEITLDTKESSGYEITLADMKRDGSLPEDKSHYGNVFSDNDDLYEQPSALKQDSTPASQNEPEYDYANLPTHVNV